MSAIAGVSLEARARQSLGSSHDAIDHMVDRALSARGIEGGRLVDVGCGSARRLLARRFDSSCGLEVLTDWAPGMGLAAREHVRRQAALPVYASRLDSIIESVMHK